MRFGSIEDVAAHYRRAEASSLYAKFFNPNVDKPKRRKRKPPAPCGLYDVRAACDRLNVTEEKLRGFIASGQLKFINVGHGQKRPRYRFSPADLDALIASLTSISQEAIPCPSLRPKSPRRTTGMTSSSTVIGFMAARAARLAKRQNSSSD